MKKSIGITMLMLLLTITIFAQKNLFESIQEFDGQTFKRFKMKINTNGFKIVPQPGDEAVFTVVRNKFGKGVSLTKTSVAGTKINWYHKHDDKVDHYSQPAKLRIPHHIDVFAPTFVMIDGVLFELRESNESLTRYDVDYSSIWISEAKIAADKGTKKAKKDAKKKEEDLYADAKKPNKKQSFASFMKNIKAKAQEVAAASAGAAIPTALKAFKNEDDVRNKISSYMKAMKNNKQKAYTLQERKEIAYMKQVLIDDDADTKKVNDAYWASSAGQETLRRMGSKKTASTFTVQNNTSNGVNIMGDLGSITFIRAGGSEEFSCGSPIFRATKVSTTWKKGGQIHSGKGVCGKTINL